MRDPHALPDAFDPALAWGTFAPRGAAAATLAACAALPGPSRASYALNKLVRGPLKNARPRAYDVMRFGRRTRLASRGNWCETTALFAPNFYDVAERGWIVERLPRDGCFVDVGGNVGLYSLHVAHERPDVRTVTVEPDPALAARMRFNAGTHALAYEPFELALGDRDGTATLVRSERQSGGNRLSEARSGEPDPPAASPAGATLEVRLTTLAALCDEAGIRAIDVLKIDIEGHEGPVFEHFLAHAPRTLWPRRIVVEHSHDADDHVSGLLDAHGYRVGARTPRNALLALD